MKSASQIPQMVFLLTLIPAGWDPLQPCWN